MAGIAVFYVAGYLIEERRSRPVIIAYPRGQCSDEKTLPVTCSDENLILLYCSVGDWTHDLPPTVDSNMVKVSHALNHSATEAVGLYNLLAIYWQCIT